MHPDQSFPSLHFWHIPHTSLLPQSYPFPIYSLEKSRPPEDIQREQNRQAKRPHIKAEQGQINKLFRKEQEGKKGSDDAERMKSGSQRQWRAEWKEG